MATDRALHRWWGDARATGKVLHGTYDEGYDWFGGQEDWPDWASVEAIAQSIGSYTGNTVSKTIVTGFMHMLGVHYKKYDAVRRNFRGRVIYRKTQRYYNLGPFRTEPLDRR